MMHNFRSPRAVACYELLIRLKQPHAAIEGVRAFDESGRRHYHCTLDDMCDREKDLFYKSMDLFYKRDLASTFIASFQLDTNLGFFTISTSKFELTSFIQRQELKWKTKT